MAEHGRLETPGGSATASVRRGIAWNADPAIEDTDTIVLTAPSGHFIDIRYPKATDASAAISTHPSYWVFSGQAFNSAYADGALGGRFGTGMPCVTHTRFVHAIDNKAPLAGAPASFHAPGSRAAVHPAVQDAGDSVALPTGEHIEWGVMPNPSAGGAAQLYKEIWAAAAQTDATAAAAARLVRVRVRAEHAEQARGEALRIGDYFQGVLQRSNDRDGDGVPVVRAGRMVHSGGAWEWDARSTGADGLPGRWAAEEDGEQRKVGDEVIVAGLVWEVVEVA